jgi:S-adenosylmethionine hydrolase
LTGSGAPAATGEDDTVFFLSDYGRRDEFVGVVHAVLRRLAPWATVVDLTHDVPPFDVRAGAAALVRALPHLGPGVVLAVVDPGVGGPRRALALEVPAGSGPRWLVGPDNGLLLPAAHAAGGVLRACALEAAGIPGAAAPDPDGAAPAGAEPPVTFDGRDLFAPAAAALSAGVGVPALGAEVDPASLVRQADPVVEHGRAPGGRRWLRAEVTWVDRFGNVQLAAPGDVVPPTVADAVVTVAGGPGQPRTVRRVRTFADLSPGEPGLLADGNGRLALVAREASAADHLGVAAGMLVEVTW